MSESYDIVKNWRRAQAEITETETNAPTQLYRHFDADGRLLYVGISQCALKRQSGHRDRPWSQAIARIDIESFDTRKEALEAERLAIRNEKPMHNIIHTFRRLFDKETPVAKEKPIARPGPKTLTAVGVSKLKPKSERYEVRDGGCRGLRVVVQTSGTKSWHLRYHHQGRAHNLTLGSVLDEGVAESAAAPAIGTPLSLAAARMLATTVLRDIKSGRTS